MPRRASCAARIVPENPPPMMATSDFIVGPIARVSGAGFPLRHMIVHVSNGFAGGLGEPRGNNRMDQAGRARADKASTDRDRADAMPQPAHAERTRVLKEPAVDDALARV